MDVEKEGGRKDEKAEGYVVLWGEAFSKIPFPLTESLRPLRPCADNTPRAPPHPPRMTPYQRESEDEGYCQVDGTQVVIRTFV